MTKIPDSILSVSSLLLHIFDVYSHRCVVSLAYPDDGLQASSHFDMEGLHALVRSRIHCVQLLCGAVYGAGTQTLRLLPCLKPMPADSNHGAYLSLYRVCPTHCSCSSGRRESSRG